MHTTLRNSQVRCTCAEIFVSEPFKPKYLGYDLSDVTRTTSTDYAVEVVRLALLPEILLSLDLLQRSSLGGSGSNDDGVLHRIVLLKSLDELGDSGPLLTNGDVDDVELLLLVVAVVPSPLVQHGVEGDGSLASLTVTDDQLTLATADRHHGVDRLEAGLHGLVDGAAGQDTGSLHTGAALLGGLDGALAVDGVAQGVDDTAEQLRSDWHVDLLVELEMYM